MRAGQASRTVEFNAALRAVESTRKPSVRLVDDPFAIHLLPEGLALLVRLAGAPVASELLTRFVDGRWPGMRSSVIARAG